MILTTIVLVGWLSAHAADYQGIDRHALVTRHNVMLFKPDPLTPLSVGNGEFAFTADITGLQTFPEYHQKGMSLGTLSQWGWHSEPNPKGYTLSDTLSEYTVAGRKVPYAAGSAPSGGYSPAASWLANASVICSSPFLPGGMRSMCSKIVSLRM